MKNRAVYTSILMMLILGLVFAGSVNAEGRYGKQKAVYHVNYDNPKMQGGALRNIQNHINAVGAENIDLRVVLHGNGLSMMLYPAALEHTKGFKTANADDSMTAKVDNLRGQGVKFVICANTIKGRKVDVSNDLHLVESGDIVPSGVAELAHLQSQGYFYVKP